MPSIPICDDELPITTPNVIDSPPPQPSVSSDTDGARHVTNNVSVPVANPPLRRSTRTSKAPDRLSYDKF